MTPEKEIWDEGLQSERTRLAWVRTAVALATGGLGAAGLSLRHGLPVPSVVVFALAALCGAVLLIRTGARFRRVQEALHGGKPLNPGLDVLFAWLGTMCVVAGAIVFVLAIR
ncbi:YidH family protein [Nonomuraea sp. NPDC051941]|uniref:YidH family protein n=1 Tax=Nonomuraea sp. NPDC051941 TaxID=3364373 RepID=UPI0037C86650